MNVLSRNLCLIYIGLWLAYELQTFLMLKGFVAQMIFVILMVMSFNACYMVNRYYCLTPYVKWLNAMLILLTFYGIIPIINGNSFHIGMYANNTIRSYTYIQNLFISVMPIYAFYYYSLKRQVTNRNIIYIYLILLAYSVISFFQNHIVVTAITNRAEIVNNTAYLFVPLIPMLSLVRIKKIWKYILVLVILGFIMLSMKRGAILTGGIVVFLFIKHHFKVRTKTQLISTVTLLLAAFFITYRFVINLYESNAFFHKRFELTMGGYSSQRDRLYSFFWNYFTERTSTLEFFFGHGANGTVDLFGQYAHNDWLELAINQGLLGVIIYIIYWCVFVREWKNYQGPLNYRKTLGDLIVTYFLISLFSGSFACMPLAATMCIGFCLANNRIEKKGLYRRIYEQRVR